ncbi:SMP-30/gluconolactonase/LRE family protein [Dermatobacter hominis]|uniref:SMP-30/gluconolactonase/LRE family protein n=1 Tax=Dermatobacter hominis TaxID=2884263 RepID=UPI001D11150F|nr:SMP-30/gluconolactonase/LRE family protein [Dermatobacter hominis]UDY37684.1 SMP-30/gluconolactonase/LRE family protein [Dermatobacter hominis]
MDISPVGDTTYAWGESVVWDDRRERLYLVDCLGGTLHWLDGGEGEVHGFALSSMPTGVVPTEDGRLLVVVDEGLVAVDPDARTEELVARYPDELGGRANDACADLDGHVITGRLNLGPAEGSSWWWSATDGWRLVDPDISNTNGPAVVDLDGTPTLLIGDTSADYYAYDYEPSTGAVGPRRVFGAVGDLDGHPDGATVDAEGGYWTALVGGGQLARFTVDGLDTTIPLPTADPTDVTFGGPGLDRLFVTAIDGPLYVVDGLGVTGRPEPRARLAT